MGENFRRKARFVAGGHTTEVPESLITYSSVVSRDSVRIALTIAGLNGMKVMACDIQNAYLTADCREKIWTVAGPEFGSEAGTIFLVKKALYGLKSAGAAFRSLLADTLMDMGYKPTKADPDVSSSLPRYDIVTIKTTSGHNLESCKSTTSSVGQCQRRNT